MLMIVGDPAVKSADQREGAGSLLPPAACFVDRTHHPRGIGMTLGVVVAGNGLRDPHDTASFPEGLRGRLPPVVTHQGYVLAPSTIRKLAWPRHVQSRQPMPCSTGCTGGVPDDLLGIPIEHDYDRHPAATYRHDLGHINAPPRMRLGWPRFAASWRPLSFQPQIGCDQPRMGSHQTENALRVDR